MKIKYLLLTSCFVILSMTLSFGQSALKAGFDDILKEEFQIEGPGATAIVAKKGKIIYQGAVGKANVELDVPMQPKHVFRIGSITKQFTAVSILMLMEEGKLSLDDEITKYLPDYPTKGKKITIEHLLTHTSGIKSMTNMPSFFANARKDMSTSEMIDVFKDEPMEFEPGEGWNYNNSGYFLLGVIIEKVTGKTYAEYIDEAIFKKVGMKNSYYDSFARITPNRAGGYQMNDKGLKNADYLSETIPYAAGSLLSTVEDLYKWNQAVIANKLISAENLKKAWTPYVLKNGGNRNYGYGWMTGKIQGTPTIEHGGGIFGFLTQGMYLPEKEVFVAVFSNCNCQSPDDAAKKMAALAIGKPLNLKPISVSEKVLKKYEGVYKISEQESRVILVKDGKLVSKRGKSEPISLIPIGKDKFNFEGYLTTLKFEFDKKGKPTKAISITAEGDETVANITDEEPVIEERKKLKLSDKILNQYLGTYELQPGFEMTVTNEDNQLILEVTGQGKTEIYAMSETRFFPTIVDAEIEFYKENGKVTHLVLFQNGMELKGKKIK